MPQERVNQGTQSQLRVLPEPSINPTGPLSGPESTKISVYPLGATSFPAGGVDMGLVQEEAFRDDLDAPWGIRAGRGSGDRNRANAQSISV